MYEDSQCRGQRQSHNAASVNTERMAFRLKHRLNSLIEPTINLSVPPQNTSQNKSADFSF